MKILLGPEYVSDEEEPDSEEASEGEQEDARDTFVDRTTVRLFRSAGLGVLFLALRSCWPLAARPPPGETARSSPLADESCSSRSFVV